MSSLNSGLLVGALARLEKVNLASAHLRTKQLCGIFKLAAGRSPSSLTEIDLREVFDVCFVPPSLRAEAQKNKKVQVKYDYVDDEDFSEDLFSDEEENVEEDMDLNDEDDDESEED